MTVSQSAPTPHVPWQGSRQWERMQAFVGEQSESATHSGRHPVSGLPRRPGSHSQETPVPLARQNAPGPHGDGTQGSLGCDAGIWYTKL